MTTLHRFYSEQADLPRLHALRQDPYWATALPQAGRQG